MFSKWKRLYKRLVEAYNHKSEECDRQKITILRQEDQLIEYENQIIELQTRLAQTPPPTAQSVSSSHTIPRSVFNRVKDKCPNTMVGSESNPTDAAFKLGVAHALGVVDREIVV